jgi:hypothetical protein
MVNAATAPSRPDTSTYRLKVSRYDQVSSMLIALLILVGLAVLLLLIIWLTSHIFLGQAAVRVETVELGEGEGPLGGDQKLEGPLDEEVELAEPNVQETLAAVADAVAAKAAVLSDPSLTDASKRGRGGGGRGLGGGSSTGSGVARRWEVCFIKGNTLDSYAQQLDFFAIELGVLMPDNKVVYVSGLSTAAPKVREGPADQEKRYYLTWQSGDLMAADRELLSRAGVRHEGRIILKFLPAKLEGQLQQMEREHAATVGEQAGNVRRTRFGVRPSGSGYAFYVQEQSYK